MHSISDYQVHVQMVYCDLGHQPITHENNDKHTVKYMYTRMEYHLAYN